MKKKLSFLFLIFSFQCFSQSYLVLGNGITLSFDSSGYVYDLGHYTPIGRMTAKGGQFLVEDNNILVTVDDQGILYRKYEMLPKQFISKGMNYFINENATLFTIDQNGVAHILENNEKVKGAVKFGGHYFFTDKNEIVVINKDGEINSQMIEGVMTSDVYLLGGHYFMTNRGVLYSISRDGTILNHQEERIGLIVKKGGNYFIDSRGLIFTVSQNGELKIPSLPIGLKISAIVKLGANYFIDGEGRLYTVDHEGQIWERWTDYDLKDVKVTSL